MMRVLRAALLFAFAISIGVWIGRGAAPTLAPEAQWSAAGSLLEARNYPRVVALPTGELLVTGGVDPGSADIARSTTELFDPGTGRSTLVPGIQPGRVNQTATLAWGDRVVVAGGTEFYDGSWHAMARVDVYLPYARRWLQGAPMAAPRADHAAAALTDGRVLVAGGENGAFIYSGAQLYDPATDRWTAAAPMPRPRTQFLMTTLPNGRVLAIGGLESRGDVSRTSLLYDPLADRWSEGPSLAYPRVLSALATLPNGDALVIGGQQGASGTAERYDWRAERFVYAGLLMKPRFAATAAALLDGSVALVGGLPDSALRRGFNPTAVTELWDRASNTWRVIDGLANPRALGTLVVRDGFAYLIGAALDDERADGSVQRLGSP
ncbi:MAG TPA: kelch repeat-containing protein [Candidatus Limnocylindria bacterium]|nr:kelch repeat-containing protein [Candidatus Limnocylindria bacterium]